MNEICPYCRGVPGVGNCPVKLPRTAFDEVLYETKEIVLIPSLGMIVPGYFLIISKKHVHSFAAFNPKTLRKIDQTLAGLISFLSPVFGKYFVFEHGTVAHQIESHGGCISHAHFHLFPTAKKSFQEITEKLAWSRLKGLSDLSKMQNEPYALIGKDSQYHVVKSPKLPSQWIRRMVVDSLDTSKHWDWGVDFGINELETTLKKYKNIKNTKIT